MSGRPENLFRPMPVPANLTEPVHVVECGCCGCWHRQEYDGDCRNDAERFGSPEDAATRLGKRVVEVELDRDEDGFETGECSISSYEIAPGQD